METIGGIREKERKEQKDSDTEKEMFFTEVLNILPIITEIEGRLKRIREQKLGDQNVGSQVINSKF